MQHTVSVLTRYCHLVQQEKSSLVLTRLCSLLNSGRSRGGGGYDRPERGDRRPRGSGNPGGRGNGGVERGSRGGGAGYRRDAY